jgi:hypothetical protein
MLPFLAISQRWKYKFIKIVLYPAYSLEQCVETWRFWRLKNKSTFGEKKGGRGERDIRQNLFFEKTLRQMAKVHHQKMLLEPSIDIWRFVIILLLFYFFEMWWLRESHKPIYLFIAFSILKYANEIKHVVLCSQKIFYLF